MLWSSVEHSTILDTDLLYIAGTLFFFLKKYRVVLCSRATTAYIPPLRLWGWMLLHQYSTLPPKNLQNFQQYIVQYIAPKKPPKFPTVYTNSNSIECGLASLDHNDN